jgi:hypothetical protein
MTLRAATRAANMLVREVYDRITSKDVERVLLNYVFHYIDAGERADLRAIKDVALVLKREKPFPTMVLMRGILGAHKQLTSGDLHHVDGKDRFVRAVEELQKHLGSLAPRKEISVVIKSVQAT